MIVLSVLLLPAMIIRFYQGWFQMLYIDLPLFMASTFSISSFYLVSQKELFPRTWPRAFLYLPFLMALGIGLTITNTRAVLEALVGKQTAFARTPKYRVESKKDKVGAKKYRKRLGWVPWVELLIGTYFASTVYYAIANENYITVPFLLLFVVGYWYTGLDVAASGTLRRRLARIREPHQAVPGWCLSPFHSDDLLSTSRQREEYNSHRSSSASRTSAHKGGSDVSARELSSRSRVALFRSSTRSMRIDNTTRTRSMFSSPPIFRSPTGKPPAQDFPRLLPNLKCALTLSGPNTYDPKAEVEAFERAVSQKPTGILVSAADPNLLKDSIDKAIAAGIPVITIDSDVRGSKRLFFIGTNNYQAGLMGRPAPRGGTQRERQCRRLHHARANQHG